MNKRGADTFFKVFTVEMFKIENTLKNKRRTYFGSWSEQAVTQYKHSSISIFFIFSTPFLVSIEWLVLVYFSTMHFYSFVLLPYSRERMGTLCFFKWRRNDKTSHSNSLFRSFIGIFLLRVCWLRKIGTYRIIRN